MDEFKKMYIEDKIHKHTPVLDSRSDCCDAPMNSDHGICSECMEHAECLKDDKKWFLIEGKGFKNVMVNDPFLSGVEVADIKCAYGYIEVNCTKEELEKILIKLYENEASFKVIGVHEAKS